MALPLSETISAGQAGHIAAHNDIHDVVNEAARTNTANTFTSEQRALRILVKEHPTDVRHPDFGADPTGVANSASAIQSALTYVGDNGTIYVPGTYNLGTTGIDIKGTQRILGAGQDESKLVYTGTDAAVRVGVSGTVSERVAVEHLTIDGSNNTGAHGLKVGITSGSPITGGGYFGDLYITKFATAGIWLVQSAFTTFNQVTSSVNAGDGLLVKKSGSASYSTTTEFDSCKFRQNTKRGALLKDYDSLHFTMCTFELNGEEGMLVERENDAAASTRNLVLDLPYFELNNSGRAGSGWAHRAEGARKRPLCQGPRDKTPIKTEILTV